MSFFLAQYPVHLYWTAQCRVREGAEGGGRRVRGPGAGKPASKRASQLASGLAHAGCWLVLPRASPI